MTQAHSSSDELGALIIPCRIRPGTRWTQVLAWCHKHPMVLPSLQTSSCLWHKRGQGRAGNGVHVGWGLPEGFRPEADSHGDSEFAREADGMGSVEGLGRGRDRAGPDVPEASAVPWGPAELSRPGARGSGLCTWTGPGVRAAPSSQGQTHGGSRWGMRCPGRRGIRGVTEAPASAIRKWGP